MKIREVVKRIKNKEILIMETETTIGIFSLPMSDLGKKINKIKQRELNKPLQVMITSFKQLNLISNLSFFQYSFIKEEWPGRKSFIVPVKSKFSKNLLDNKNTILIRMPSSKEAPQLTKVLKKTGPLFSTSANITTKKPFISAKIAGETLNLPFFVEGIKQNGPSVIISLMGDKVKQKR